MKKVILLLLIVTILRPTANIFSQNTTERILTKRIVYSVRLTDNKILSSDNSDSVEYSYIINKRFFWEAMDDLLGDIKAKKIYLTTFAGDTLVWDSVFSRLTNSLNEAEPLRREKYSKKDVEKVLENEIRAIKFMEEWTYNPQTMQIDKKISAFCPVLQRDSIVFDGDELKTKSCFEFELGWVKCFSNKQSSNSDNLLLIARNIQYTMPIYNSKPYHWWDNNLEAEYSVPFFSALISKADSRLIPCYENPDAVDPFSLAELEKRKKHSVATTIFTVDANNEEIERDTIINLVYTSDDIDHLRFGEELIYDKENNCFIKNVNYYAPIIRLYTSQGTFVGFYPLYYIRKQ